jgi:AraC family transcriptional regulator
MQQVEKAVWFIENHFGRALVLDEIAANCGASRFYLSRLFGEVTGRSISAYLRGRRLSEAARVLAAGAPDILLVALDAGYNSHEAFTRAFRDQFGMTPELVRARGNLDQIQLVEPISMNKTAEVTLAPPRFETGKTLLIAGLGDRYTFETNGGIPMLWQRAGEHFGHIPGRVSMAGYGVCYNFDDEGHFDYLAGAEVKSFADLPAKFTRLRIPARNYAVFTHEGHISGIGATHHAIWSQWIPANKEKMADAPSFEWYAEDFDPVSGMGGVEVWIPVK